jgi:electron transfer flavoprotein alpha subunit
MDKLLVLLHTSADGQLPKAALEAVALGASLGEFDLGIVGLGAAKAAEAVGSCGAKRFSVVEGPEFAISRYSSDAAAAEAVIKASGASVILAPCTSRWHRSLPGVAQRLGSALDTHAVAVAKDDEDLTVSRWFYRQRIEVTLTRKTRPWIILVDGGAAVAWSGAAAPVTVETVAVAAPPSRTAVIGIEAPAAEKQTIRPDANLLFVAGAGWTKKQKDGQIHIDEAAGLILGLVNKAQASLGSSKSLVDLSGEGQTVLPFLSHVHQVGQTGSTPRHAKGLATCCHGEEPHVVGWRFINERRAVNLDPNCGWARGKADVLYVADAFEVVRELTALL